MAKTGGVDLTCEWPDCDVVIWSMDERGEPEALANNSGSLYEETHDDAYGPFYYCTVHYEWWVEYA